MPNEEEEEEEEEEMVKSELNDTRIPSVASDFNNSDEGDEHTGGNGVYGTERGKERKGKGHAGEPLGVPEGSRGGQTGEAQGLLELMRGLRGSEASEVQGLLEWFKGLVGPWMEYTAKEAVRNLAGAVRSDRQPSPGERNTQKGRQKKDFALEEEKKKENARDRSTILVSRE